MGLFELILILVVVGLVLYAVNRWIPMDPKIKQILNVVVIILLVIWLLSVFLPGLRDIQVG